jgi:hypothetical protein
LQPEFEFVRTLQHYHVTYDKHLGRYRISSKAFSPSSTDNSLSGDLEELLKVDGLPATAMYPAVEHYVGAAALKVEDIRALGLEVEHQPVQTNWYHGGIVKIRDSHKKKLEKISREIIQIDQEKSKRFDDQRAAALVQPQP